ncbi:hypothetical protein Tco_0770530 [Tanacetum coccineum]|uniref:Uncharacterized protein n=1 Tax=Tanacetum coccineum TaxID=301880 RepID=A0ABQ4ZCI3_9ASTR
MKEEFPGWFGKQIRQRHVDNDLGVNESSELFALACGPSQTPISVNSCVVNGVSLNDLEIAALHINGQSIDVDAPPDIIDVVDEDDDIIDEEDLTPHDLADSDDEDLVNLDIDDGVNVMSTDVARGHGGDGVGDDRPLHIRAPESPIWVAGERAGCIPARRPGTSGELPRGARLGVALALPFLAPNAAGAEGGGRGKDWDPV